MTTSTTARTIRGVPPRVDGKFLQVEGRRFLVKGVTYGTFAPDADGAHFPPPAQVAADFASMAAAGLNTVRTYMVPSTAVLDAAAQCGLRVMVGIPWSQHVAFLDDRDLVRKIRRDALSTVRRLSSHPASLIFAVGNEIPAAVVRWHARQRVERFLRELYDEIKSAVPESLLTYVNFPPTEYLDLDCFDVCAFNVYLHRETDLCAYLARLQHIAGSKPLLLAEAGTDSLREGLDGQAHITAMHVRTAFAEGACGAVVFSWTDEWWRGGHTVEDWAFGLVDTERRPKPALAVVEKAFADAPFNADEHRRWPKVSVVVCAHNAAQTIDDCLTSLTLLTYPDVEVIVVNDGSRDATGSIARTYSGVRVIDVPNGGLSLARNIGLAEANGEIVAYTDADVRVDPDWLTYLVRPLLTQDVAAAGGPNVVPRDDCWVAQCVARAPGGPTHVLLDDRIAEHVPGCNMVFRRDALLGIGGFNPVYVRAGDDVDVCWRLQAKGLRIGFAAAALVWHHHRDTVGAFWRQQVGYGEAEAWLRAHHPEKFANGEMLWHGRIYSTLPFVRSLCDRRVNTGSWGTAPFPSVYYTRTRPFQFLPHSPTWMAVSAALFFAGVIGLWTPFLGSTLLLGAGVLGCGATLVRCALLAWRSDLSGLAASGWRLSLKTSFMYRVLIVWLHVLQPIARMRGRLRGIWSLPQAAPLEHAIRPPLEASLPTLRDVHASGRLFVGVAAERSFWSESWVAHTTLLTDLAGVLRSSVPGHVVDVDDGWHADRDLSYRLSPWTRLHVRVLVEEHSAGRCLVRVGTYLRPSRAGVLQALALAIVLPAAVSAVAMLGWPLVGAATVTALTAILVRTSWQTTRAIALFDRALGRVTSAAGMLALPVPPQTPTPARLRVRPATLAWALQAAILVILATVASLDGRFIVREVLMPGPSVAGATTLDSYVAPNGGVAVGIAGDVFVADAHQGLIRRLRPRPPRDASWTAHYIGTDGNPVLGTAVPFPAPADIVIAANGDLYVADARGNRVRRVVRASGTIMTVAGSGAAGFEGDGHAAVNAALNEPSAVAVAHNGDVYVADTLNNRIRLISQATGLIRTIAGDGRSANDGSVGDQGPALRAQLSRPTGIALAPNGDLYVADTGHNRVRMINAASGLITTLAGTGTAGIAGDGGPAALASLDTPMGVALVPTASGVVVYVADSRNNRVRVIDASGRITTLSGPWRLVAPTRIAYHPAGWLYVKDASPDGFTALAASQPLPRKATGAPARPAARKVT